MRQQLWGHVALLPETLSKHLGDQLMQPAVVAQKHAVGNLPDQYVVEGIALRHGRARAAHQPHLIELGQSVQQWLF